MIVQRLFLVCGVIFSILDGAAFAVTPPTDDLQLQIKALEEQLKIYDENARVKEDAYRAPLPQDATAEKIMAQAPADSEPLAYQSQPYESSAYQPVSEVQQDVQASPYEPVKPVNPLLRDPAYGAYEQARLALAQQRLDLASKGFDEVTTQYAHSPLAVLSQFWKAEILARSRNYPQASIAYGQAYGSYKSLQKSGRVLATSFGSEKDRLPEILAKLAYSLKMVRKRTDACLALRQMKREFPNLPANLHWYVGRLSADLKCR